MDISVSCPDNERLWKVSTKSESWFPIKLTQKSWNFFEQARRPKFQISLVCFIFKKSNFEGTELKTRRQFSPKLFMALQCQNRKLLCQYFAQAIYFLAKTNLWNLKFWPFLLGSIKLTQFFLGWFGNRSQFFLKLFMVLQCHNTKLLPQFLAEPMYLLFKTIHKI